MAKMVEIKLRSVTAELEKLMARKERCEKKLAKAEAKAEKFGVLNMSNDEHTAWLKTVETDPNTYIIIHKEDVAKNGAWFDLVGAIHDLEDVNSRIENAQKRYEKQEQEVAEYHKEVEKTMDAKAKEALWQAEFEAEQKEWAKDGIKLDKRYEGTTPNGNHFEIWRNSGWTDRSFHCFTLYINGHVIFTSGEFWRCYMEIKNR